MDGKSVGMISVQEPAPWKVYIDGIANHKGSSVGLVLISPESITIEKSLRLGFLATNNEVEYEALLEGMIMVQKMGGKVVELISDSRLVIGQVHRELEAKDPRMQKYLNQVRHLQFKFKSFNLLQVPRSKNTHADSLTTLATSSAQNLPRVILVEDLCRPTKVGKVVTYIHQIRAALSWIDPIVLYLKEDILLEDKSEADKGPYARLLVAEDAKEAEDHVKKYDQCQRFAPNVHQPGRVLNPLFSPWLFAQWGLDIIGHFPKAVRNKRYLLVGTNYFTKWVETEPLSNIRDVEAKQFILKNIITRFRVPCTLISDNGLQYDSKAFRRYCYDLGITNRYSTLAYPHGNGQAEAMNKVIVSGLKKRLDDAKGKWVEELQHFVWTYRTTTRRSTRETPFSMTYVAEFVIPLEIGFPTLRTSSFTLSSNDELLERSLDLVKERRENAMVQLAYYQHKLKQSYDANVKLRPLAMRNLVLRKVMGAVKNPTWRKLGSNWEGPYHITLVAGIGAYYLEDLEERVVPCP
ncbi:uncharacterized protein LOC136062199 [Quercus suber]|uniref:uncharacterized protein LOC136062199 n=1 Tax=Quercus suber TaxID=58331 RepID=UPI0032DF17A3